LIEQVAVVTVLGDRVHRSIAERGPSARSLGMGKTGGQMKLDSHEKSSGPWAWGKQGSWLVDGTTVCQHFKARWQASV